MVVCDRDHVIAVSGVPKKEILERRVSPQLEEVMELRKSYQVSEGARLQPVEGVSRYAAVAAPIISSGDVAGSILLLESEEGKQVTETEIKLIQAGASFLGKQMEE